MSSILHRPLNHTLREYLRVTSFIPWTICSRRLPPPLRPRPRVLCRQAPRVILELSVAPTTQVPIAHTFRDKFYCNSETRCVLTHVYGWGRVGDGLGTRARVASCSPDPLRQRRSPLTGAEVRRPFTPRRAHVHTRTRHAPNRSALTAELAHSLDGVAHPLARRPWVGGRAVARSTTTTHDGGHTAAHGYGTHNTRPMREEARGGARVRS